jgi:hypothetical protein
MLAISICIISPGDVTMMSDLLGTVFCFDFPIAQASHLVMVPVTVRFIILAERLIYSSLTCPNLLCNSFADIEVLAFVVAQAMSICFTGLNLAANRKPFAVVILWSNLMVSPLHLNVNFSPLDCNVPLFKTRVRENKLYGASGTTATFSSTMLLRYPLFSITPAHFPVFDDVEYVPFPYLTMNGSSLMSNILLVFFLM